MSNLSFFAQITIALILLIASIRMMFYCAEPGCIFPNKTLTNAVRYGFFLKLK